MAPGQLISLDEARRYRRGSAVRPLFEPDRGQLIPWPWATEAAEAAKALLPTHRARHTPLERWMPTIVCCGTLVGIFLVALLIHGLFSNTDSPRELPTAVAPVEIVEAVSAPATEPTIRSTIRVIAPNYTVTSGDTLSGIAQKFNTSVAALTGINNLPINIVLSVGQHLVIPTAKPSF